MPLYRVTANLVRRSGIPADNVNNVWHVDQDEVVPDHTDDIANAFVTFYQAIQDDLAPTLQHVGTPHTIEVATVAIGAPGQADDDVSSPIRSTAFGLPTVGGLVTALPAELAVALSIHGDLSGLPEESGLTRPRSRRRGRVYIGPLGMGVREQPVNAEATVTPAFQDKLLDAAEALYDTLTADGSALVIYSRTAGSITPVIGAFVDNAFDIVRSRGNRATSRDVRSFL